MEKLCIVNYLPDEPVFTRKAVNQAYCETYGVIPEKVVGRSSMEAIPPGLKPKVLAKLRPCINQDSALSSTQTDFRSDGYTILIRWVDVPVTDFDGNIVEMVAVGQPISERRMNLDRRAARPDG